MMKITFATLLLLLSAPVWAAPDFGASTGESAIPDDYLKLRDPFKRPPLKAGDVTPKSDLEAFSVEQFKMVGVIAGDRTLAMLVAPNGKTYFVSERMKIGLRKGIITRITPKSVKVLEKIINVLGKEESVDYEIPLPPEYTKQSTGG